MSAAGTPPGDERKIATVLFADLVGSTQFASDEDPERVRALLERFYESMGAEIETAGGTVEKFAGDAVMAAFGAPAALEDHAERALHAALAMQRRLRELFGDDLGLRIGVNTGEVVVGRSREGSSFVSGDTVNVAARLEQAAGPGDVLVGERTAAAARGAFEFEEPMTIEAKGKAGGVAARRLIRSLTLMRPRGVSGLKRSFVGREGELDLLQATYKRVVTEGRPHLVTVMGDAGVGKTRLVRELWERLGAESPEPLRRTGRCLPYGRGITYWALGEILKEHLGLLESDPPETAREKLGAHAILGLALGRDVGGDLHPLAAREQLQDATVAFLEELALERPLVMLVEDIHWAEEPLLDLLERVLRDMRGPLLILATARLELLDRRPSWGGGRRNMTILGLEPLSTDDTSHMLDELLAADLPERVRDVIVSRAEGNPFFVEELVGSLTDAGVLQRENGSWHARELPAGYTVPDSVQAVVAARIDLLGEVEKDALQAAAVIGRVFWPGPVRDLLGGAEPDFAALEERDFVRRRAGTSLAGEREFAFKHALTREVAYASLTKARRARLHAEFAGWLERVGEGRDEWAALLAHHYTEAVRPEDADLAWPGEASELERLRARAVWWLRRAADLAIGRYEIDDALAMLQRAVELVTDDTARGELWRTIGRSHALKFDGPPFWEAMEKAIELSEDSATTAALYAELALETTGRSGMWRRLPDHDLVAGWIDRAIELSAPETPARVKAMIARCYWDIEKSAELARDASALADRLGDPDLRSYAFDARVVTAFGTENFDEAMHWAQRRLDLAEEVHDPDHLADLYATGVPVCVLAGRFREARRLAALNEKIGASLTAHHQIHGIAVLLEVDELTGEWGRIRELIPRVEAAVEANLDTPCVRNSRSLLVCAVASAELGDQATAQRLEESAQEIGQHGYTDALVAPRLRLALGRGQTDLVRSLLDETFPLRRQYWFFMAGVTAQLDALAELGERRRVEEEAARYEHAPFLAPFTLRALGVVREDHDLIRQALERFEALKLGWHAEQTRALL
ncbi:MAG TPA: adenylate/guanylate cyclase domain-containing protein [Gaiellaceae bacterium]